MDIKAKKLSVKEIAGYSLGDMAYNFYFQMAMIFMLYFYTDVFGISAAVVGTMFLVSKIWDAINDPMMGGLADRTESRWGKFRPWILFAAFPLAISGVLCFTAVDLSTVGKIVWAYVTYNLLMMTYTAGNVPYSSLMGVMTADSDERTLVNQVRFIFANGAMFIVQALTLPLVGFLGKGNDARGFMLTMVFFSTMAIVFLTTTFLSTKERIKPEPGQKTSIIQDLKDLFKNRPWVILFVMTLFVFIYWSLKGSIGLYYTKYFVNHASLRAFLQNFGLARSPDSDVVKIGFTFYSTTGVFSMLIGILFARILAVRFGKRDVFRVCLFLAACSTFVYVFLKPEQVFLQYLFNILIQLSYGVTVPLLWAMVADVADFTEWKTRRRATAITFAGILFALKLGLSFGSAIAGKLLGFYNYTPNVQQTATTLKGIRYMMSVYPAILFFLGVVALLFYQIDRSTELEMEKELIKRREKYQQA
ncbi:MFS transporter [candidate division WOR-3 bacterium]|nr:MFS transporter [candidate division WOR-3 bacterium]